MLQNYLKTAFRNLWRYRMHTALNVVGLSVGIAGCILAMMYIRGEYLVEGFHKDGERIYRVVREVQNASGDRVFHTGASGPLGPFLEGKHPEVEQTMRMWVRNAPVEYDRRRVRLRFAVVDPDFFEFFSLPLEVGNPVEVLAQPNSIVLAKRKAKQLFGDEQALGKIVRVIGGQVGGFYTVTGVMGKPPALSHLEYDCFVSKPIIPENWQATATVGTYVRLQDGLKPDDLNSRLSEDIKREPPNEHGKTTAYHFVSLKRFHLDARSKFGTYGTKAYLDREELYTLIFVVALTLVIACANFVNLSTARGLTRAREVGLRKVVGARPCQLIGQFIGEAMLVVIGAAVIGIGMAEVVRPWFADIMGVNVRYDLEMKGWVVGAVPVLVLLVGLLAGGYPAFFLSRFNPVNALKDGVVSIGGTGLRKALVVVQFVLSIFLITGTAAAYFQTHFLMNRNLGFDSDYLIVLPIFSRDEGPENKDLTAQYEAVKNAFLKHPNVIKAAAYRYPTGRWPGRPRVMRPEGVNGNTWQVPLNEVDEDFLDTFGIRLVAGRDLYRGTGVDEVTSFLVNETAVRMFGWDDPIGKQIEWVGTDVVGTVVGVMADFHTNTLKEPIGPVIFCKWDRNYYNLGVKAEAKNLPETIAFLKTTWERFLPEVAFEYEFLKDDVRQMYDAEERYLQILSTFAGLAILVACLGLIGLIAFMGQRRAREIAIRKVLGATVGNVLVVISKELALLVTLANLVAIPVAYIMIGRWLDDYAYRVELGVGVYASVGLITVFIAVAIIVSQALRLALANPAEILRAE